MTYTIGQLVKFDKSVWPELANNSGIVVEVDCDNYGYTNGRYIRIYVALSDGHAFNGVDDITYGFWPVMTRSETSYISGVDIEL